MEVIISSILGELASRSMSFLADKYLKWTTVSPTEEERVKSLQRLLLRVHVIVEEAEERRMTNQAMLHQLSILKKEMYRSYYTLDMYRCRAFGAKDDQASHAFTMSRFNPAKRVCFCSGSSQGVNELQRALGSLQAIITDLNEFVVFLTSCPRLYRQPYSMYLLLDNCMFARQMEMERVINFLLQSEIMSHGAEKPGVLPIIGPRRAGKSTLVEHACNNERVRDHFSQILFFTQGNLEGHGSNATLGDGGVIKHRNRALDGERVLVIVELDGDRYSERLDENINEGFLGRLYSAYKSRILPRDSKIIVTSQSDKIASFGTTVPLRLELLTQEAFWYWFKVRTFGSTDAVEHPNLALIAMEMSREFAGCFLAANCLSELLRSNMSACFWSSALATYREFKQKNALALAQVAAEPAAYNPRSVTACLVTFDGYQTSGSSAPAHSGAELTPKLSLVDVMFGRARPRGRFDALAWKSPVPPHYSYMFSCEIRRPKRNVGARN